MKSRCALMAAVACAAATMLFSCPAFSADPSGSASNTSGSDQLEEVIVTAEKREETLLRAPLAVTAVSQKELEEAGVVGLQNLTSTVPDLEMRSTGFADAIQLTIRGITNDGYNEPDSPAVATYIDGVYVGHTTGLNGALYDLARVEVARGPQGTLYGRNSTGGNVNIITADPENAFDAFADVSYGNYNDVLTHGMVNIPVGDTLAVRASFVTHRNDGYVDTEHSTSQNYDLANDFGGRVTALWTPSASFRWRLSVDDFIGQGTPQLDYDTGPNGTPTDGQPIFNRIVPNVPAPELHNENFMVRSTMSWTMSPNASLTYIAGYQDVHTVTQFANTSPVPAGATFDGLRQFPANDYSHELDLNADIGKLHNIVGATYFYNVSGGYDVYHIYSANIEFGVSNPEEVTNKAWGIFDQATYGVTDSLRVVGGVRYSSETQSLNQVNFHFCSPLAPFVNIPLYGLYAAQLSGPGCALTAQAATSGKWSNVSWKGGLEYDVSNHTSSYATVTTGFKSGGLNPGLELNGQGSYAPEQVTNYEIGFKTRLLDDKFSYNAALFYENYRDLQVTQLFGVVTTTESVGSARIYGIENEVQWRLSKQDHLSAFFNYLNATYTEYNNAVDAETGDSYASLSGRYLPHAPRESARLQYSHDFSLANGGTLSPMAAAYGETTSYLREFNFPIDRVGGYTKTNLTLTYTDPSAHWKTAAYVNNLENSEVRTQGFVVVGHYFSDYAPPRTFGVRFSYEY